LIDIFPIYPVELSLFTIKRAPCSKYWRYVLINPRRGSITSGRTAKAARVL
jgi:hypothetical protein